MPEVELTVDEVSALVLAAAVARAMPGGSYPKIVDLALKKLAFDLPDAMGGVNHVITCREVEIVVVSHFFTFFVFAFHSVTFPFGIY